MSILSATLIHSVLTLFTPQIFVSRFHIKLHIRITSQMEFTLEDTLKEIKIYKRESFNDIIQKLYNIRVDKNE